MAFPNEIEAARSLVEEHNREIPDEKLKYAAYYSPNCDDPYIIEVLVNFGYDEVGDGEDLMDTQFKPFDTFARSTDRPVHLVLTNPREFQYAIEHDWPGIRLIREAVAQDRFMVLFDDKSINITFQAVLSPV